MPVPLGGTITLTWVFDGLTVAIRIRKPNPDLMYSYQVKVSVTRGCFFLGGVRVFVLRRRESWKPITISHITTQLCGFVCWSHTLWHWCSNVTVSICCPFNIVRPGTPRKSQAIGHCKCCLYAVSMVGVNVLNAQTCKEKRDKSSNQNSFFSSSVCVVVAVVHQSFMRLPYRMCIPTTPKNKRHRKCWCLREIVYISPVTWCWGAGSIELICCL